MSALARGLRCGVRCGAVGAGFLAWLLCIGLSRGVEASAGDEAAAERALAARIARELTTREGKLRPDDQLIFDVFGRPLIVSGGAQLRGRFRADHRLNPDRADDDFRLSPEADLDLFLSLTRTASLYVEAKVGYDRDVYAEDGIEEADWRPRRGETWVYLRDMFQSGLSLQVGNQNFEDDREWWWDEDLEGARLFYEFSDFELSLAGAERLAPLSFTQDEIRADLEDVLFVTGTATWFWNDRSAIDLFGVYRRDHSDDFAIGDIVPEEREDGTDSRLWWLGLRAQGRFSLPDRGRVSYWLDTAMVHGREVILDFDSLNDDPDSSEVDTRVEQQVSGWGIDIGATWDPDRRFWPRPTVAYAFGSGDTQLGNGRSRAFRQTGIQDNNDKFGGVDSFKYYGELMRPELSNIHITTAAIGFSLLSSSSIELVHHAYWQDEASPAIRDSRLKARPLGKERFLGQEWDVVVGIEEWKHWSIELVGGLFLAGRAFGPARGQRAYVAELKLQYGF